jgi:hypothetical protein
MKLPPLSTEAVLWLGGPLALSIAMLVVGLALLRRSRPRQAGWAVVLVSIAGLLLSAAWIAVVMRVEAIEHDSQGRHPSPSARGAGASPIGMQPGARLRARVTPAGDAMRDQSRRRLSPSLPS